MTPSREGREAGPELNIEVAETVFGATGRTTLFAWHDRKTRAHPVVAFVGGHGWSEVFDNNFSTWVDSAANKVQGRVSLPKDYSGDIAAAFLVVEAMRAKGWHLSISDQVSSGNWFVEMWHGADSMLTNYVDQSPTLPLAICRAALKALAASSAKSAVPETEKSVSVSPASL